MSHDTDNDGQFGGAAYTLPASSDKVRPLEKQADAWVEICNLLDEVHPGWDTGPGKHLVERATAAIKARLTPSAGGAITECPDGQKCNQQPTGQCWGRCVRADHIPSHVLRSEPAEPVRDEVARFAVLMERKLKANDHKDHWSDCGMSYLLKRLREELVELEGLLVATSAPGQDEVAGEAADVANFAMMIADNFGALPTGSLTRSATASINAAPPASPSVAPADSESGSAAGPAVAAPSGDIMKFVLNEEACRSLRDWLGTEEKPDGITLHIGPGHSGDGLYVSNTEYPSEGADFLAPSESRIKENKHG